MEGILIVLLVLLLTGVGVLIFFQIRKTDSNKLALFGEKLAYLETLTRNMQELQLELRGVRERTSTIEQNQNRSADQLGQSVQRINSDLQQAMLELKQLETHAKARHELEQNTAESIRRLEMVIAGTQTKGRAGENIVEVMFSNLPAEWQVRNFTVANKSVEFGLRLPSGCVLPIDSKWAATNLLEQFMSEEDADRQQRLKKDVCEAVRKKAKEVKQYIDPPLTTNFAIAVIPDAIYELSSSVQADAFQQGVVVVNYSMFVPYLLLVFQTILKTTKDIDLERLSACLFAIRSNAEALQAELEGRFADAITRLSNSRNAMSSLLGKVSKELASLQTDTH